MSGPLLPGESAADIRAVAARRNPSQAGPLLPGESQAQRDLARLAYLQGLADGDGPDCDSDPFY